MAGDKMKLTPHVQSRVDQYLDAVDRVLGSAGKPRTERRNITDDVETQILDMLAARAGAEPTVAEVEAVLSQLDPPEAYAQEAAAQPPTEPPPAARPARPCPPVRPRLSRAALIGALLALPVLPLLVLLIRGPLVLLWTCFRRGTLGGGWPFVSLSLAGLTALFGTTMMLGIVTMLGIVAISQIRHSAGRLYGLGLALFDALLFPVLLLDVMLLSWGARLVLGAGERVLIALAVDLVIVLLAWRAVRKPVPGTAGAPGVAKGRAPRTALGALSLVLCLGGLLLPVVLFAVLWPLARAAGAHASTCIPLVPFGGCEIAALVLGIIAWSSAMGKTGAITSAMLMALSVLLLV